ncbi:iron-containing alcohol dehydrogenase [Peribacillus cavernae]|uniref:hydroxyacid-oxoacid transhydrogenase n=1 Tax=Peribacillus cavernae TaxID=1674310 RepID=A0A3S0U1A6_9BACI|nr:hydroxyacid-oxoacid transhydrogenase [Peribacillus cavernae]MDQ0221156.1 alcohol dehydrogenase class IV [Peribacillus cavernae]RUQ29084.1 iron-containing alcohol dehydrogenase [Peribacillus cavernae]
MRNTWDFFSTERIVFGNGAIQQLDSILQRLKAKNVLLITDPGIKQAGIVDKVVALLEQANYHTVVYDQVVPEPPVESAMDCYKFAKSQMETDAVIGLGGGSSIDMAKVVSLLVAYGGHPLDYYGGENQVPGPIAPLVAIPTTAGTGSEVTSVAVLTDVENNLKVGISDNFLRPTVALVDPELTVGLPAYVTACSGIDALAHAIEAYTAKPSSYIQAEGNILFQGSMPISDALAYRAIELIVDNLALAVQQGSNLEARSNMLLGSLLAGMSFSNAGTAAAHALAYPIGGLIKSPHGEVTGLLLPYVMEFNTGVETEKMVKISEAFGINSEGLSKKEVALAASTAVLNLLEEIGLPTHLSEIGIKEEDIPEIAEKTLQIDRLVRNNPRVPTQRGLEALLRKAL